VRIQLSDDTELRDLTEADAGELYALVDANREHLAAWMPWAADQDLERTAGFLHATSEKRKRGEALEGALVVDGRIVGCAGFPMIDRVSRAAMIGYWIATEHEGRGLVTRAVSALIDHAFGELGLHRVEIQAATGNVRSRAVPERLGFTQEGVLREAELVGERYQDLAVYGLLASDVTTRAP
jgi:ribosomal-protein-serine acetyltransferase